MTGRRPPRWPAPLAGVVAVGVALGVAELAAGLLAGAPSLVDAVGQVLIPRFPVSVEQWAIATFGTSDKAVLSLGIVLVALGLGAAVGRWAGGATAAAAFAIAGGLGLLAALTRPAAVAGPAIVATTAAVAAGVLVLTRLRAALHPVVRDRPADPGDRPVDPGPRPTAPPLNRRRFLALSGGLAATALVAGGAGRVAAGMRARAAQRAAITLPPAAIRLPAPTAAHRFDIPGLSPLLTPNDDFYRIDTALSVPRVPVDAWRLRIHGLVDAPYELTYDELLALPLIERDITLACVSNEVGGDLVGTARWLGVRLDQLLERARPRAAGDQVVGRAVDGFTIGFPTAVARDGRDALVAVGMNGEPLPLAHGFPARLVVPGLYGYVSATKWLADIEVTTWEGFDAYWVPRGWAKQAPIKLQSRIDVPARRARVAAGEVVVAGVAWAPTRGIGGVEVQVDDAPWTAAQLASPLSDDAWVPWRTRVTLPPGRRRLRVRARDAAGGMQPPGPVPPRPDGAEGWHTIEVDAV